MRRQRTLRHPIGCVGVGLHSGARVGLTLRPAAEGSGIRFRRLDRPGSAGIPAHCGHLVATADAGASLGEGGVARVRMVEHLLAALAICEIDNAQIELGGPELPVMDGSAQSFVLLIECAGAVEQSRPAARLEVLRPISVHDGGRQVRLEPASRLELLLRPRDGVQARGRSFGFVFSPEAGKAELAAARDRRWCPSLLDGGEPLRFADEPLRHAALDVLGDLALLGARLQARYVEHGGDHALRARLMQALLAEPAAWRLVGGDPAAASARRDAWHPVAAGQARLA